MGAREFGRIAVLGVSATLIATSGFGGSPALAVPAPTPSPAIALNSILSEVGPDGTVSKQSALQAFSDVIGPLPGVTAVPVAPGEVLDGTFAVNWVLRYWDQLTEAQRAAIRKYLPEPPGTTLTRTAGARGAQVVPAMTTPPVGPYRAVLKNEESEIAAHIGRPLGLPLSVVVNAKQVTSHPAYTVAYDSSGGVSGRPASCVVYINPSLYHSTDVSQLNNILMHEMFHCFQATDYATVADFANAPGWLIEGSAEWVSEILAPSQPDPEWAPYLLRA